MTNTNNHIYEPNDESDEDNTSASSIFSDKKEKDQLFYGSHDMSDVDLGYTKRHSYEHYDDVKRNLIFDEVDDEEDKNNDEIEINRNSEKMPPPPLMRKKTKAQNKSIINASMSSIASSSTVNNSKVIKFLLPVASATSGKQQSLANKRTTSMNSLFVSERATIAAAATVSKTAIVSSVLVTPMMPQATGHGQQTATNTRQSLKSTSMATFSTTNSTFAGAQSMTANGTRRKWK